MGGFTSLYPNLPGMLVTFKDGGMALRTTVTTEVTDSMLILGTSLDGPVLEPVAVDATTAGLIFGADTSSKGVTNGSSLLPAFKQAWDGGCRDIRLMRISGSGAQVNIVNPDLTVTDPQKQEESLGVVGGNEDTTIDLAHGSLVSNSAKVYVKGVALASRYTVDETKGSIDISADIVDAGASVSIAYDYYTNRDIVGESKTLDATLRITTASIILDPTKVVVKFTGIIVPSIYVTVTGQSIRITNYNATTVASIGDTVTVDYTGVFTDAANINHAVETGTGITSFVTLTAPQVFPLLFPPATNSFHLYINAGEVLTPSSYTVDATAKTITIYKENFTKGSSVDVSYLYDNIETITPTLVLESTFGGEVYSQGFITIKDILDGSGNFIDKLVIINKPDSKKTQITEAPLQYSCNAYRTFELLMNAINSDSTNGVYKASTDFPGSPTDLLVNVPTAYFVGGDNGINLSKDQLFKALSGDRDSTGALITYGAYQLLENYVCDFVVPAGVYADDITSGRYDNFAYELALFCAILSYRNKTTLGGIALKPATNTGLAGIKAYGTAAANYPNAYIMRDLNGVPVLDGGKQIDLGKYVSIVCGPEPIQFDAESLGTYFGNPAIGYIAMNTNMLASSAPTNKLMAGARGLRFNFSNQQLDDITANRIVTFKTKTDKSGKTNASAYVVDAMTAALTGSDYTRITTLKVLKEVVDQLRDVADPYIGESVTVEQKNALASAISKRLGILKDKGFIRDSAFTLVFQQLDTVLGSGSLELSIVPPQELRKITTVVSLKSSI